MKPGVRGTNTVSAYFGKGSPNAGTPWYEDDYNNFGPAVGFAWQLPWLGQGKTTIRGGYQVTYQIVSPATTSSRNKQCRAAPTASRTRENSKSHISI